MSTARWYAALVLRYALADWRRVSAQTLALYALCAWRDPHGFLLEWCLGSAIGAGACVLASADRVLAARREARSAYTVQAQPAEPALDRPVKVR